MICAKYIALKIKEDHYEKSIIAGAGWTDKIIIRRSDCGLLLDVGAKRLEGLLHDHSDCRRHIHLLLFYLPGHPLKKYKQETPDEMAEAT